MYLGGANGSEIFWVGEENGIRISNVVVEVDVTLGGICFEIGSQRTQSQLLLFTIDSADHPGFFIRRFLGNFG